MRNKLICVTQKTTKVLTMFFIVVKALSAQASAEDELLSIPKLSVAQAELIAETCIKKFRKSKLAAVAIFVFDPAGIPLAYRRMDGTASAFIEVARVKGRAAALYGIATREMRNWAKNNASVVVVPDFNGNVGGVPIRTSSGIALGGVGVSGTAADDDEACAMDGIKAIEHILEKY